MILNVQPVMQHIRETDFASASPAKARAICGILRVLATWVEDGNELMTKLQSYQHDALQPKGKAIEGYDASGIPWASLPLKKRLLCLQAFYQEDIHLLSAGDDQKAHRLLEAAELAFQLCSKETFQHCDTQMEEFLLYFHVLCMAHPGYRNPANTRLYLNFDRVFNALPIEEQDLESDVSWQYREVRWCRDMLHEQHFDRSLLPGLTFVEPAAAEAFRLQCYRWMLFIDPESDGSIQEWSENNRFMSECIRRIHAWLRAKDENHIGIDDETLVLALLTLYCGINTTSNPFTSLLEIEERAYDLFDRLPASKQKTHLMAQVAANNEDPELMAAVHADIATWAEAQLSQEDKYLMEFVA